MVVPVNSKLYRLCDKLVTVLLCVLMADCAVFGAGRSLSVGPLGFRMVLLGAIMVASVPLILGQFSKLVKNRYLWLLAAFAGWLALEAVLGIINGNSRALLAGDIKGFAYFVAVLPVLCVLNTKDRIHKLMQVIMYASAVLAVVTPVLVFLYNWAPGFFTWLVSHDSEHDITMFAAVSSKIPRLFYKSTPYFLCGCAFPIYFCLTRQDGKLRWHYAAIAGVSLFALLLSYTRSIYLAVGIAAAFLVVVLYLTVERSRRVHIAKAVGASALSCVLLIGVCSLVLQANYFGYALDRLGVTFVQGDLGSVDATDPGPDLGSSEDPGETDRFQNDTIESDKFRAETMAELMENIKASPIWGHGLGKALEVRNGEANEYIYQDIWMKTGIIGLALFFGPLALLGVDTVKKLKTAPDSVRLYAPWLAVLLGFVVFSYFNPYMNAALGILFYCCTIGVFCADHNT